MNDKTELDDLLEKKLDEPRSREQREKESRENSREIAKNELEVIRNLMKEDNVIERIESIVEWMNKNLYGSFKISKRKFFIYSDYYYRRYELLPPVDFSQFRLIISKRSFLWYKKIIWIKINSNNECEILSAKEDAIIISDNPDSNKSVLTFFFRDSYLLNQQGKYYSDEYLKTEEFFKAFKNYVVETFPNKKMTREERRNIEGVSAEPGLWVIFLFCALLFIIVSKI